MHDLNAVFNTNIHIIQSDNIFGVMVFDFHEVAHLTVGALWQLNAYLHIDPFVTSSGHKVDLLGIILTNIHIVPPPL